MSLSHTLISTVPHFRTLLMRLYELVEIDSPEQLDWISVKKGKECRRAKQTG